MDHLRIFQSDKGVICDIFTDRTFLWGSWVLAEQGIIPYTSEWIGFLHHCPNEEYTPNNAQEILRSPLFRRSLPTCKGLFCLSETLASWYQKQLPGIKVESLHHPTLFVDRFWAPDPHIRLINVGAWYRDPFAIYELEVPSYVDKWSLKGPRMEQYFRPDRLVLTHEQILNPTRSMNRWVYYLCKYLQRTYSLTEESLDLDQLSPKYEALAKKLASVQVLDRVSNQEYDELFSNSVIFLRLVDASAVNTVIEAIVRNTPILINRLPALEEYLGSNYPLFYENLSEASALLTPDQLERAHLHLQSMDRSFLKIDHFLEQYLKSEIYQKSLL